MTSTALDRISTPTPPAAVALTTRQPTGRAPWPLLLIAGAEKAGKSWACAAASGADLIGRTLWLSMGEDDPDEYALVEGARFEIVEHDGTYRGFLNALDAAVAEPRTDDKPTLIVVDSMTRLWNLLSDMAQDEANARARRKGKDNGGEADITMDLWNTAKQRWAHVMDALRSHRGPVLLTARLDEVTVMQNGRPTAERALKVQAEKSLVYDVGGIIEMPERGKAYLKGVRSTRLQLPERALIPGFTVDELWRRLGLYDDAVDDDRTHTRPARGSDDSGANPDATAADGESISEGQMRAVNAKARAAGANSTDDRNALVSHLVGRQVTSLRQLTTADASALLDRLKWLEKDQALAEKTWQAIAEGDEPVDAEVVDEGATS